jgi:hypothetical protein
MRIHLISDLHLETCAYTVPTGLECDVIVAAGDIGVGTQGVEYLKTLPWPVVYVPGNHEYYPSAPGEVTDCVQRLAEIRSAARGTNVHVLDGESVVVGATRFVGATLWTDFGGAHDGLIWAAQRHLRDYDSIGAGTLNASSEFVELVRRFEVKIAGRSEKTVQQVLAAGLFHPAHAYGLHRRAVRAIDRLLSRPFEGATVVVTHHAPSYAVLRETGIRERALEPAYWHMHGIGDHSSLAVVAGYASNLDGLLRKHAEGIALWCHGHRHFASDIAHEGVRIVCNPRGRQYGTRDGAAPLPDSDAYTDSAGFQQDLVLDTDSGLTEPLRRRLTAALSESDRVRAEIRMFGAHVCHPDEVLRMACEEAVEHRVADYKRILRSAVVEAAENLGFRRETTDGTLYAAGLDALSERRGIGFAESDSEDPTDAAKAVMAPIERMLDRIDGLVRALPDLPALAHARVVRALAAVVATHDDADSLFISGWVLRRRPWRLQQPVATLRIGPAPDEREEDESATQQSSESLPADLVLQRQLSHLLQSGRETWTSALNVQVVCGPPRLRFRNSLVVRELTGREFLAYAGTLDLPEEELRPLEDADDVDL